MFSIYKRDLERILRGAISVCRDSQCPQSRAGVGLKCICFDRCRYIYILVEYSEINARESRINSRIWGLLGTAMNSRSGA